MFYTLWVFFLIISCDKLGISIIWRKQKTAINRLKISHCCEILTRCWSLQPAQAAPRKGIQQIWRENREIYPVMESGRSKVPRKSQCFLADSMAFRAPHHMCQSHHGPPELGMWPDGTVHGATAFTHSRNQDFLMISSGCLSALSLPRATYLVAGKRRGEKSQKKWEEEWSWRKVPLTSQFGLARFSAASVLLPCA